MNGEKKQGEEQVLSAEDFMASMQQAAGVQSEPNLPDDASDMDKRVGALEAENGVMKFQMGLENVQKAFKSRFPDATESQMQAVVGSYYRGNPIGIFDGIANATTTTAEKEQNKEGVQNFEVEDESSDDATMDENYIPGSMGEGIALITGEENYV